LVAFWPVDGRNVVEALIAAESGTFFTFRAQNPLDDEDEDEDDNDKDDKETFGLGSLFCGSPQQSS
jgi:hypothetical protein